MKKSNTREMPGFTAEASLYSVQKPYHNADSGMEGAGSESVIPQAFGCRNIGPCIPFIRKRLRCCAFPPSCKMVSC